MKSHKWPGKEEEEKLYLVLQIVINEPLSGPLPRRDRKAKPHSHVVSLLDSPDLIVQVRTAKCSLPPGRVLDSRIFNSLARPEHVFQCG